MHLAKLELTRFRSFPSATIPFDADLTVLVGENNGGKSSVVDAIRLLSSPLNGRRERYCEESDLQFGAKEKNFDLKATYARLSTAQKGLLVSAVPDPTEDEAVFGLTHDLSGKRGRTTSWAAKKGVPSEPGASDLIRHVFLPALRDAQRALASGDGRRIAILLSHFLEDEDPKKLAEALARQPNHKVIGSVRTAVDEVLDDLTGGFRKQVSELGFGTETLIDVARDLRFRLGDAGVAPSELAASGLGYANLLYMTTVVIELERAKEADLTLFLVEEPEAHLNPQLQMLVLDLLKEKAKESAKREKQDGQPEGRIQVVATTHSPNLTAWVAPKHLVVLRSHGAKPGEHRETACVAVGALGLDPKVLAKIERYLDVTRSALLFGGRVILVEGIAEAILLPVLAKRLLANDREGWKRFQGATLVPIDGVDFAPYVRLLLTASLGGVRVADRVVVVTDRDPKVPGNRASDLAELAKELGAQDRLDVFTNTETLEADLYSAANAAALKAAFLELHRNSAAKWQQKVDDLPEAGRAKGFRELFEDVRKGDFAQALAQRLSDGAEFKTPPYLEAAIQAAIKDDGHRAAAAKG